MSLTLSRMWSRNSSFTLPARIGTLRLAYLEDGSIPDGLEAEVEAAVALLEERVGMKFGDPAEPLLVSVRSGAAVSMPGMMDTVLNLGLSDATIDGHASRADARFAQHLAEVLRDNRVVAAVNSDVALGHSDQI